MGVDFYNCKHCGEIFSDHDPDYVYGECCDKRWCSSDCAEMDGYKYNSCKLGKKITIWGDKEELCDYSESDWCGECEYIIEPSCKYCRGEDITDEDFVYS